MANLFNRISVQRLWIKPSTDGGNAASTYIDMTGFDGALILLAQGATEQGTTGSVKIRNSSDASTSGAFVVTKTSATRWDSSGWSSLAFDIYKPRKRYINVLAAMTSGKLWGYALKYGGRQQGSTENVLPKTMRRGFTVAMSSAA